MLSGDNARTAAAIGKTLGIEAYGELMPEDKAHRVREWQTNGHGPVGKVGDGINDAPALAAADVGIAMGGGTDVALETADAALLKNRVTGIAELIDLSRATRCATSRPTWRWRWVSRRSSWSLRRWALLACGLP